MSPRRMVQQPMGAGAARDIALASLADQLDAADACIQGMRKTLLLALGVGPQGDDTDDDAEHMESYEDLDPTINGGR